MPIKTNQYIPSLCVPWMYDHKAFLVGSGAHWYLSGGKLRFPRDLDFVIDPREWNRVTRTIEGRKVRLNRFGGLKLVEQGVKIDVWPAYIEDYFEICSSYPKPGIALRVCPYLVLREGRQ